MPLVGKTVTIVGHVKQPELNGTNGEVQRWDQGVSTVLLATCVVHWSAFISSSDLAASIELGRINFSALSSCMPPSAVPPLALPLPPLLLLLLPPLLPPLQSSHRLSADAAVPRHFPQRHYHGTQREIPARSCG